MMKRGLCLHGFLVLLIVLTVVMLAGCNGTSPLVGKWEHVDEEGYLEFSDNGTLKIAQGSMAYNFEYEETGDYEITLTVISVNGEFIDSDDSMVLTYSFSGDEMTMTDGENPETFKRVK